jgi:hypothetical protein
MLLAIYLIQRSWLQEIRKWLIHRQRSLSQSS